MIKSFSEFFCLLILYACVWYVCMCMVCVHVGRSVCVPLVVWREQLTGADFSFHYVNPKDQIQQMLNEPFLWTLCLDFYKNLFFCTGASKKGFPCYTSLLDTVFQEPQRNLKEIKTMADRCLTWRSWDSSYTDPRQPRSPAELSCLEQVPVCEVPLTQVRSSWALLCPLSFLGY